MENISSQIELINVIRSQSRLTLFYKQKDIIRPIKKAPKIRSDHDIFLIQEATKDIPFFQKYIQEGKGDVHQKSCKYMTYEKFNQNEIVFSQGERGSKFYIILEGLVGIFIKNKNEMKKVKELKGGESFGELALINDAPRSASIKSISECHFAVLDKKNNEIKKAISFYPEIELFSNWNYNKIKSFYNNSFRISVKKSDRIILENDPVDAIYIIVTGEFVVKKKIDNEDNRFNRRSDLQQLKKQALSYQNTGENRLFIMSKYEIFGQEDAEQDDPKFRYSVECCSFEGSLIYIKIQDYMKIILKDESQKEYIQNYSLNRMKRVSDRLKEVSSINKSSIKIENTDDKDIQQMFQRSASTINLTNIPSSTLQNNESDQDNLLDINFKPRQSQKKRRTYIDVLDNQNIISNNYNSLTSNNNNNNNNNQLTLSYAQQGEFDDSYQPSPLISGLSLRKSIVDNQSGFNYQRSSITDLNQQGRGEICQQLKSSKSNFDIFNSKLNLKVNTNLSNQFSLNNSNNQDNGNQNSTKMDETNTPLSGTNLCYTPVSNRINNSLIPIKKGKTLSNFYDQGLSPIKINQSNNNNKLNHNNEVEKQIQNGYSEHLIQQQQQQKQSDSKKQGTLCAISMKFINDEDEEENESYHEQKEQEIQNQNKYIFHSSQTLQKSNQILISGNLNQIPVIKSKNIASFAVFKSPKIEEVSAKKEKIKKQSSQFDIPDINQNQLHPLVKGFHEQLKMRFYTKFKNGSIEHLKSHISHSPIQSLQPEKIEFEQMSNALRPTIFSNKKMKESKTKELRDYENKLKQIIKSDNDNNCIEAISPLRTLQIKSEHHTPISSPHLLTRDKNNIFKRSLLHLFQNNNATNNNINIQNNNNSQSNYNPNEKNNQENNSNDNQHIYSNNNFNGKNIYYNINDQDQNNDQSQDSLKERQKIEIQGAEKINLVKYKHYRVGSLDSVQSIPIMVKIKPQKINKGIQDQHIEEEGKMSKNQQEIYGNGIYSSNLKEKKQLKFKQNLSCLPILSSQNIQQQQQLPYQKTEFIQSYLGSIFNKSTNLNSNSSSQLTPHNNSQPNINFTNNNTNKILTPKQYNTKISSQAMNSNTETPIQQQKHLFLSNRVGFKGQKGFNCSQFNLRKDKFISSNI